MAGEKEREKGVGALSRGKGREREVRRGEQKERKERISERLIYSPSESPSPLYVEKLTENKVKIKEIIAKRFREKWNTYDII